jgi:hypothetical protein
MSKEPRMMSKFIHVIVLEPQEVEVDAGDYWDQFSRKDKAVQYAAMRDSFFWKVMAPHFGQPQVQWEAFLTTYLKANTKREGLLMGPKKKRRVNEHFLYQVAIGIYLTDHPCNYFEDLTQPPRDSTPSFYFCDEDYREWRHKEFSTAISSLVGEGNYQAIEKLATIVEEVAKSKTGTVDNWHQLEATHPKTQRPLPPEGETTILKRWKIFCDYVIENRALPTKITLNTLWLNDCKTTEDREKLGLNDLP